MNMKKANIETSHPSRLALLSVLVFSCAVVLYWPVSKFGFTNWDDGMYITDNRLIQVLSLDRIFRIFSSLAFANYHPITLMSFALQYAAFGQNPSGYHLMNIFLHAVNGVLVLILMNRLTRSAEAAFLTALAFVMHPLQVESVAWISSHKTLLSAFFSFLTLLSYHAYLQNRSTRIYWVSLLAFVLAVFSKPTAMTLPLLLYPLDRMQRNETGAKSIKPVLPFFGFSFLASALVLAGHLREKAIAPLAGGSICNHSVVPFWTLFVYIRKIFLPTDLLPQYPLLQNAGWTYPQYQLPALITILVMLWAWAGCRRWKTFSILTYVYVALLLPTLNFLPLSAPLADRYMYLPILAPLLLCNFGITFFCSRWTSAMGRTFSGVVLGALLVLMGNMTRTQMELWRDSETLWKSVIRKVPAHAMARAKLGEYYYAKGDLDRAIKLTVQGISLGLGNPVFAKNLVAMYIRKGEYDRARESALNFLQQTPNDERFYMQLGIIAARTNHEQAEEYYKKATEINPKNAFAWYELGKFYLQYRSDAKTAYTFILKSITLEPYVADFHIALADCFGRVGDLNNAIATLQYALTLDKNSGDGWFNLARLLQLVGQKEASLQAFKKAYDLNPSLLQKQAASIPK